MIALDQVADAHQAPLPHRRGEMFRRMTIPAALPSAGQMAPGPKADEAQHPCVGAPLIARSRRARAALGPSPRELGLLLNPSFILRPQF